MRTLYLTVLTLAACSGGEDPIDSDTSADTDIVEDTDTDTEVTDTDTDPTTGTTTTPPDYADCVSTTLSDDLNDGLYEYSAVATHDGEGRRIRLETDTANDGDVDAVETWTWSTDLLVARTEDIDNDGIIDTSRTYSYDADDRLILIEEDTDIDADEAIDTTHTYVYNADGNVETITRDDGLDGADHVDTYVYDAAGELLRIEGDDLADGVDVDSVADYSQTPDVGDIRVEYDTDNDGIVSEIVEISSRADGQPTYYSSDGTADEDDPNTPETEGPPDGLLEVVSDWTYNPNDTVDSQFVTIWFPDGIPGSIVYEDPFLADFETRYSYDSDNRLSGSYGVFDINQNGMVDLFDIEYVQTVTWDCPQ